MRKKYYLIEVQQGVEPFARGPFQTGDERDDVARQIRRTQEEDDCLFWVDVDEAGGLTVGPYIAGFFWQEPTDNVD